MSAIRSESEASGLSTSCVLPVVCCQARAGYEPTTSWTGSGRKPTTVRGFDWPGRVRDRTHLGPKRRAPPTRAGSCADSHIGQASPEAEFRERMLCNEESTRCWAEAGRRTPAASGRIGPSTRRFVRSPPNDTDPGLAGFRPRIESLRASLFLRASLRLRHHHPVSNNGNPSGGTYGATGFQCSTDGKTPVDLRSLRFHSNAPQKGSMPCWGRKCSSSPAK